MKTKTDKNNAYTKKGRMST